MTPKALAPLALLIIALLAYILLRDEGRQPDSSDATGPDVASTGETLPASNLLEGPEIQPDSPPERERIRAEPQAVRAPVGQATAAESGDVLRGSVVLLLDGGPVENSAGFLKVTVWEGNRGHTEDVQVVDGRFELPRAGDAGADPRLELRSGVLDGRSVVPTERDRDGSSNGITAEQGEFHLQCVPRGAIVIEVRDAESGAQLDEVEITAGSWSRSYPG